MVFADFFFISIRGEEIVKGDFVLKNVERQILEKSVKMLMSNYIKNNITKNRLFVLNGSAVQRCLF